MLFLKDYASYIKDSMFSELTELNRNLMLSIDVIHIPTDEAVREVEFLLLGVETNVANWQRRQNANNNFTATIPYDMELQRKESKEFWDDLTTRDQRMMFAGGHNGDNRRLQGTAGPGYGNGAVYSEKAHVPDGDAEVSADGWTEYGAAHRDEENQRVPNPHHGEPGGTDAFQGAGDHG